MGVMTRTANVTARENPARITITVEMIAYVLLAVLALTLRLAELDTVPLNAVEAREALAAWRVLTPLPDVPVYAAQSQIVFLAQSLAFSLFGASDFSARFLTALVGAFLVLSPLLFRDLLGAARSFALALLLTLSPILLIASRESASIVWAALFAAGMLWGLRGWWRLHQQSEKSVPYAMFAAICGGVLIFLCGASGVVLAAIIGLASAVTMRSAGDSPENIHDEDYHPDFDDDVKPEKDIGFPWGSALPAALVVLLMAGTSFLLHPSGLSAVGNSFAGLATFISSPTPAPTAFHPLVMSIFYEPYLWVMALIAVARAARREVGTADRFFTLMAVGGALAGIIFGDAPGSAALWLTLPLAGLAAAALVDCFTPDDGIAFLPAPGWARWVVAFGLMGALAVFTLAFQELSRALINSADGTLAGVSIPGDSVVLLFVSTMFIVIGFFLFASLWGARTTWQGIGIGAVIFFGITSLGSGWATSALSADMPAQLWDANAPSNDIPLLRETLLDLADREGRGFNGLPIYAQAEPDSLIAWILRDFPRTTFINQADQASGREIILIPAENLTPNLTPGYVGQEFLIERNWASNLLGIIDLPALWTQRLVRSSTLLGGDSRFVLWLRQDIYDGVDEGLGAVG